MNHRVKLIRKQLKLSQEAFGTRLGITGAGISKIESGQRNLTEQMLLLICREFQVNDKWLRSGEGAMYKEKLSTGLDQLAEFYQLDEIDLKIVSEFVKLDEKKRKVIKEYILSIAKVNLSEHLISDGEGTREVLQCAENSDYIK